MRYSRQHLLASFDWSLREGSKFEDRGKESKREKRRQKSLVKVPKDLTKKKKKKKKKDAICDSKIFIAGYEFENSPQRYKIHGQSVQIYQMQNANSDRQVDTRTSSIIVSKLEHTDQIRPLFLMHFASVYINLTKYILLNEDSRGIVQPNIYDWTFLAKIFQTGDNFCRKASS